MINLNPPFINTQMPETFPDHIKFVIDAPGIRQLLRETVGENGSPKYMGMYKNYCYIRIDLRDKSWRPTMTYEWLYRNTPPLIDNPLAIELLKKP